LSCHCCCGLLLVSSIAESSRCLRNFSRNSVRRLVLVIGLYPLEGADEVGGEVVVVKVTILHTTVDGPWTGVRLFSLLFIPVCVCVCVCFCLFLSSLVRFLFGSFQWFPEEELTLLFLLHRENGDFSILMKDILIFEGEYCWLFCYVFCVI
jgi:hypothetical protein